MWHQGLGTSPQSGIPGAFVQHWPVCLHYSGLECDFPRTLCRRHLSWELCILFTSQKAPIHFIPSSGGLCRFVMMFLPGFLKNGDQILSLPW